MGILGQQSVTVLVTTDEEALRPFASFERQTNVKRFAVFHETGPSLLLSIDCRFEDIPYRLWQSLLAIEKCCGDDCPFG
jgi:hypothetical protein